MYFFSDFDGNDSEQTLSPGTKPGIELSSLMNHPQDMYSGSEINDGLDTQTNIISNNSLNNDLIYTITVSDTEPSRTLLNTVSDTEPSRALLNTVSDTEPSRALLNKVSDTEPSKALLNTVSDTEPSKALLNTVSDTESNPVSNFEANNSPVTSQPLVSNIDPVILSYTGSDVESLSTPGSPRVPKFSNLLTKDPLNPRVLFYQDIPRWEEESFPQYFPRY